MSIVNAFGNWRIGVTEATVGTGGPDDGRFMDLTYGWHREIAPVLQAAYLKRLVKQAKRRQANLVEFHGWPEIRYRDDGTGEVYSRVRFRTVAIMDRPRDG